MLRTFVIFAFALAPLAAAPLPRSVPQPAGTGPVEHSAGATTAGPQDQGKRRWVPGRYEIQRVRVRKPPTLKRVWVPPVYRSSRDRRGNPIQVLVKAGYWKKVLVPGRDTWEKRRVWVKGHWVEG